MRRRRAAAAGKCWNSTIRWRSTRWTGAGLPCPLARDLTAPLAAIVNEVPRQYFRGFTAPTDTSVKPKLLLLEPYQRGKIPVVFIHGLYSDPITWVDMINELCAQSDLYDQFQFWTVSLSDRRRGAGVGRGAAAAIAACPRNVRSAAHRPGAGRHGVGRAQLGRAGVRDADHHLVRSAVARNGRCSRSAPCALRRKCRSAWPRDFFFEPVPMVKRVVFIGTPHHGSGLTRRLAGCVGSELVSFGSAEDERVSATDRPKIAMCSSPASSATGPRRSTCSIPTVPSCRLWPRCRSIARRTCTRSSAPAASACRNRVTASFR